MKATTLTYLIAAAVAAVALLLVVNLTTFYHNPVKERYISPDQIRGIEVVHRGIPYTLNFEQQNTLLTYLNQSVKLKSDAKLPTSEATLPYDKIILYRFNKPELEVTPAALYEHKLYFSCKEWNPDGYLQETGPGSINTLLNTTFDP